MPLKKRVATNAVEASAENKEKSDALVRYKQRLRMQRFGMAVATYAIVILAAAIITWLGHGTMKPAYWVVFIGLALIGNSGFFLLIYSNANLHFADPSLTQEQIIFSALWGMVPLYALPQARPIILMFYLPAFSFGMLRLTYRQYLSVVAIVMAFYASLLGLEIFQGRREINIQYEFFLFVLVGILLTWFAVFGGYICNIRMRLREQNRKVKKAQIEKDRLIAELQEALKQVNTLTGLLPICMECKKIRDDKGYWNQIESYIRSHSEAEFSHGICPDCAKKMYAKYDLHDEN
jgi:hypothetical protein